MRIMFFIQIIIVFAFVILPVMAFSQSSVEDEARTYLVRGMAAIEMAKCDDELAGAAEEFKKATEIAPNMAAAWYNLGKVQSKIGQIKEAIDSYNRYLTLAPQADDARKIKDEVIKLGYRLEQSVKFKSLSGTWIMPNTGHLVKVNTEGSKLTLNVAKFYFRDSVRDYRYDTRDVTFNLELKGNKLIGLFEASGPFGLKFDLPPEKSRVEGTLNNGRMILKFNKMKFNFVYSSDGDSEGVIPSGKIPLEWEVMGPLPPGGLNVELEFTKEGTLKVKKTTKINKSEEEVNADDVIISVNGTDLLQLPNYYERMMKLRGQPGSTVQLVVQRPGFWDKEVNLTVHLVEAQ